MSGRKKKVVAAFHEMKSSRPDVGPAPHVDLRLLLWGLDGVRGNLRGWESP